MHREAWPFGGPGLCRAGCLARAKLRFGHSPSRLFPYRVAGRRAGRPRIATPCPWSADRLFAVPFPWPADRLFAAPCPCPARRASAPSRLQSRAGHFVACHGVGVNTMVWTRPLVAGANTSGEPAQPPDTPNVRSSVSRMDTACRTPDTDCPAGLPVPPGHRYRKPSRVAAASCRPF